MKYRIKQRWDENGGNEGDVTREKRNTRISLWKAGNRMDEKPMLMKWDGE